MSSRRACTGRPFGLAVTALAVAALALTGIPAAGSSSTKLQQIKKDLLVRSDFPKGWTTSSSGNSNSTLGAAQFAACLGVPVQEVNYNAPSVNSPEFDENDLGLSVNDTVSVFPSQQVANEQFDLYASPQSPNCSAQSFNTPAVRKQLAQQAGTGVTVGTVTATSASLPKLPRDAAGVVIDVPLIRNGVTLSTSLKIVVMMSKRLGCELTFIGIGSSFSSSLQNHLEELAAKRLGS